jgi:DNA-binding NarL/FixJ family response regulator
MRVVLIGPAAGRARLRRAAAGAGLDIAGEARTVAAARAADLDADAFLVAVGPDEVGPAVAGETLTPRERSVLDRVAEGHSNRRIAEALGISDQTVKSHVASICGKLGALNRTEAVRIAIARGLVVV